MSIGSNRSRMRSQSNATTQYSHSPIDGLHPIDSGSSQVPFVDRTLFPQPMVESPNEATELPAELGGHAALGLGMPSRRRGSILSDGGKSRVSANRGSVATRDALVGEVLAEEHEASEKVRKEEEQQTQEEEEGKKPWYSAWLYHNSKQQDE